MKDHYAYIIAGNPNTPKGVLNKLSVSSSAQVRRHVAENPKATAGILQRLTSDPDSEVKVAAALNKNCPVSMMYRICMSDDLDALFMMAEETNLPKIVIEALSDNPNPFISARAKARLSDQQMC